MVPPSEDLYAFLGIPPTSVPAAIAEAIARIEKRLAGKHGLGLTELSRRRSLLLQAKRWLVPEDRRAEYDLSRNPAPTNEGGKSPSAERATPAGTKPKLASSAAFAPSIAAAPPPAPPVVGNRGAAEQAERVEEEADERGVSILTLAGALVGATLLAFVAAFSVVWALSGGEERSGAVATSPPESSANGPVAETTPETAPPETVAGGVVRANADEQVLLTPTSAKLVGPNVRLDGAENPPRIENWTSQDVVEWDFESPSAAIYQATLEYGMKPECEGNRYKIVVGSVSIERNVGGGSFADGAYRDVFFMKIPSRGLSKLRIEPLDVVGGELMQFRSLTLAPRQKTSGE